jgi:altronate dehydratase
MRPIELGKTLYVVQEGDNVAIALDDVPAGEAPIKGGRTGTLLLTGDVPYGHKAALVDIKVGEYIIKHGHPIGIATKDIPKGAWVHVHNVKSCRAVEDYSEEQDEGAARVIYRLVAYGESFGRRG